MTPESCAIPLELRSQEYRRVPPGPDGSATRPLRFFPEVTLVGHSDQVNAVAFMPDSSMLASSSRDGVVRLWDVEARSPIATLTGHTGACAALSSLAFSADGELLACGCDHGSVLLWEVADRRLVANWSAPWLTQCSVAFSQVAPMLACNLSSRSVELFDTSTRTRLGSIDLELRHPYISSLALSPDGRTLAVGSFDCAKIVDLAPGLPETTLEDTGFVTALAYRPDGTVLAVAGEDKEALAAAGDGGFGTAHLFTMSGKYRRIVSLPTDRDTPQCTSVAFHPDGSTIASGHADGMIRLWHYSALAYQAELTTDEACAVAFSPDGTTLAVGCGSGVSLWKSKP